MKFKSCPVRSFARLLIPTYDKREALADLHKGLRLFEQVKSWSRKQLLDALGQFYNEIAAHDADASMDIAREILEEHATWLRDFNKVFTGETEDGQTRRHQQIAG